MALGTSILGTYNGVTTLRIVALGRPKERPVSRLSIALDVQIASNVFRVSPSQYASLTARFAYLRLSYSSESCTPARQ